ncbi:uncharacterized protein LTR77_009759 [Saxophila tyrrhenica]|uniref:Uncharacterized protein n=1 Tax=Saxophila tyrrhenica TaxID=1690608 RepID=A0AAV9P183_9PEZI|nr:hypothetical protein LTR77_009759 [Saxophila tyrrhenica]
MSHLSAVPNDPYQWRESVLSTRSLSYLSVAAAHPRSRSTSSTTYQQNHPSMRRDNTDMTDESEYSLEMTHSRDMDLNDIPELPESVARSPLFLLPREIRDRVYAFCLTAEDDRPVEWPSLFKACHLQPQLLRTCKIIHDEAAPLLYTLNNLTFHHPSDANMFVRAMASTIYAQQIQHLSLHIRAQDTRLWMPYLTSRDSKRSLEADFPCLRNLHIRFRSNKWQHSHTPEANLKTWAEDSRLDEVIDSVRNVYLPAGKETSRNERGSRPHRSAGPLRDERAFEERTNHRTPTIRLTCVHRIHPTHFTALTNPPATTAAPTNPPDLSLASNPTGVIQQTPPTLNTSEPPSPVLPNAPFTRYTPIDLRTNPIKRLHDRDLGSTAVAQTVFTERKGVLICLEINCLDPKREV